MELFEAPDSKSFLKLALEQVQIKKPKFGYAALVRKAGLSSRSFPRDIILGKKFLSADSARKLGSALSLNSDLKTLFLLLVDKEEAIRKGQPTEKIANKIQKTRNRIRQKSEIIVQNSKHFFYSKKGWIEVWASLSSSLQKQMGVSLEVISKRAGLSPAECESILNEMSAQLLIHKNPEKNLFSVISSEHMILESLGEDSFFQSWFLDSLAIAKKSASMNFNSDSHLFMNSVVLVRKDALPNLKKELKELMVRYIDQIEDSSGDHLARLSLSFF